MTESTFSRVLAGCMIAGTFACGSAPAPEPAPAPAPAVRTSSDDRVNDANIAALVLAANNADIAYAHIALAKAVDPRVKQFAETMINDHSAVNKAASDLVTRLGVTPADNERSLDLRDRAEEIRDELREKDGKDFDRSYLNNEVKYHGDVLDMVDKLLVPSATNEELRNLLTSVRPAFAAHLEHAKQLQKSVR